MKWVRCPSCRTEHDVDRYPQCDGCNRDLTDRLVLQQAGIQKAQAEGSRVSTWGRWALRVLGLLSALTLIGMILAPVDSSEGWKSEDWWWLTLGGIPIIGLFLWVLMLRRIRTSRIHASLKALFYFVSLGLAGIGAVLLSLLACSAGGMVSRG